MKKTQKKKSGTNKDTEVQGAEQVKRRDFCLKKCLPATLEMLFIFFLLIYFISLFII